MADIIWKIIDALLFKQVDLKISDAEAGIGKIRYAWNALKAGDSVRIKNV